MSSSATPDAPLTPAEEAAVAPLLRRLWGDEGRIVASRVALRRRDYAVALLELAGGPGAVAIKLAGPAAPLACPFDRTAATLRLVRERTALPVPEPLVCDTAYRDLPWRYLITTVLPGTPWRLARLGWTAAELGEAQAALGRAVAALHALRFPAHGEIGADGRVADGAAGYAAALAARAGRRIAAPEHAARFLTLLAERRALLDEAAPAALAHEDLNPTNLLVARDPQGGRWELTGLLDFDSAWAGSPESDLARLALWDGLGDAPFRAAYAPDHPLTPAEAERRLLLQLLWCLEYAQPTTRHHADTARLCAALGIAPFAFG